jgi:hypothetical protein
VEAGIKVSLEVIESRHKIKPMTYSVTIENSEEILVHNVISPMHAWRQCVKDDHSRAGLDYWTTEVNPDMGESHELQYDHVLYA